MLWRHDKLHAYDGAAEIYDGILDARPVRAGGIVGEIRVRDGDKVSAGDLVIRLHETVTRANLQVITRQLDELEGRQARLKAERDGAAEVPVPRALADRRAEPEIQEILGGEQTLFESRRTARTGQKAQLSERTKQLKEDRGTDRAATGQGRRDQARQDRARRTARALGQELAAHQQIHGHAT